MRTNRLVFIFVLVVLAAFIYGITTNAPVKNKGTLLYNPDESLRFPVQTIQNTGQFDGLLRRTVEEFRTIDAINLYQESGDQKLSKVVFGKLKSEPRQYAFVIIDVEDEKRTEITYPLPIDLGDNARIVGVGKGEDFFVQNEKGNEFMFKLDRNSNKYTINFIKSCERRCP